jgi:hypothetical protein
LVKKLTHRDFVRRAKTVPNLIMKLVLKDKEDGLDDEIDLSALKTDGIESLMIGRRGFKDEMNEHRAQRIKICLNSVRIPLLISRDHAIIRFKEDGTTTIESLSETNGTYINNVLIDEEKTIENGWVISFGGPSFVIRENSSIKNPFRYTFIDQKKKRRAEALSVESKRKRIDEELECAICHEIMIKPYGLQCSHVFCGDCLFTSLKYNRRCPYCRKDTYEIPVAQRTVEQIIELIYESCPERDRRANEFNRFLKSQECKQIIYHLKLKQASHSRRLIDVLHETTNP